MPLIHMSIVAGRPEQDVQNCIKGVAHVVSQSLSCPINTVRIVLNEIPETRFAVGDQLKSELSSGLGVVKTPSTALKNNIET